MNSRKPNIQRAKNAFYREREFLTVDEVHELAECAGSRGRHQLRDRLIVLMSFHHGLRAGEIALLKWESVLPGDKVLIKRLKGSKDSIHPLQASELELLQQLQEKQAEVTENIFVNERGGAMTTDGIRRMVGRAATDFGLSGKVHPHMLRHSCGYWLAGQGIPIYDIQAWLGHRQIQNTMKYIADSPERLAGIQFPEVG